MNGGLQPIVGALTAKGPEAMGAPEVDAHHYIPMAQPIAFHATQDPISGSISPALGSNMYAGVAQPVAVDVYNQTIDGQVSATLTEACGGTNTSGPKVMQAVAQPIAVDIDNTNLTGNVAGNLCAEAQSRTNKGIGVMQNMAVRRLTPVECERLQGFPDNYTAIPWRGKEETPDGPRYKALGNSMAVPVMKWIGENIREVDNA
jgi:hypothetical protein